MGWRTMTNKKMSRETARNLADVMRTFSRTKTVQAKVLTAPTDGSGKFSALVSTFGPPPDTQGDVIDRHAFDRTITEAMVSHPGSLWGVWYEHGYSDPQNVIGVINAAAATDQGLVVVGTLSIDRSQKALEVYHALLDDRLREWSIGYGITSEHTATWNGEQVQVLTEVELLEISCVHKGANRLTRTLDIKTADTKPAVNRQALKDLVTVGKAMLGEKARPPLSEGVDEAIVVSLAQAHLVFDHGMPEAEVLAMSYDEMRAVHPSEHERGADHEHDVMTTEGETSAEPEPNDPKRYAKMLDDLENANAGPAPDPDAVDRFVTETGQVMVEEKLAEAELTAWERRMQLNTVLDPMPVRVDARMRPVTS
jgi:HK97 family phage prohead protease